MHVRIAGMNLAAYPSASKQRCSFDFALTQPSPRCSASTTDGATSATERTLDISFAILSVKAAPLAQSKDLTLKPVIPVFASCSRAAVAHRTRLSSPSMYRAVIGTGTCWTSAAQRSVSKMHATATVATAEASGTPRRQRRLSDRWQTSARPLTSAVCRG